MVIKGVCDYWIVLFDFRSLLVLLKQLSERSDGWVLLLLLIVMSVCRIVSDEQLSWMIRFFMPLGMLWM